MTIETLANLILEKYGNNEKAVCGVHYHNGIEFIGDEEMMTENKKTEGCFADRDDDPYLKTEGEGYYFLNGYVFFGYLEDCRFENNIKD